jgi:uncharacterized protein (TIGR02646 family)
LIHVSRTGSGPSALVDAEGRGRKEARRAQDSLDEWTGDRAKWTFGFSASGLPEVTATLAEMFHGKCAYCETSYDAGQPMDVEHWRPKAQVECVEGPPTKPAYYWLAASWENLLPSCIDCNRRRKQTDVLTGKERLAGKADQFPLDAGSTRATAPGQETGEVPLLLNPCDDEPEAFLRVTGAAVVKPAGGGGLAARRARASIDVYALNRSGLVLARKEHLRRIKLRVARIRTLARLLEQSLPEQIELALEELLLADLRELARMRRADQPYAFQARQLIDEWMSDLVSDRIPEAAFATPTVPGRAE